MLDQVIRYNLVWESLRLLNRELFMKSVGCAKRGYTSITC
jgi:hypothetical protein